MTMNLKEYTGWLGEISKRYRQSQIKAAVAVNTEMLKFYFSLGHDIVRMEKDQPWGSGFLKRLSVDLKMQMPEAECFSARNIYYMRYFFELYANAVILPQLGAKLVGVSEQLPQVGAKSDQSDFSSARRRTTRWSSGRLSRRNSQSVFPNTASARFCQKRLQVTFRVSPTLNPQSAV